jgi:MerE protein
MNGSRGGSCDRCGDGDASEIAKVRQHAEGRGVAWVMAAFLICPCHLPITLWLGSSLLAGTAAGAVLRGHPFIAAAVITLAWAAATWHGFRLMRSGPEGLAGQAGQAGQARPAGRAGRVRQAGQVRQAGRAGRARTA